MNLVAPKIFKRSDNVIISTGTHTGTVGLILDYSKNQKTRYQSPQLKLVNDKQNIQVKLQWTPGI